MSTEYWLGVATTLPLGVFVLYVMAGSEYTRASRLVGAIVTAPTVAGVTFWLLLTPAGAFWLSQFHEATQLVLMVCVPLSAFALPMAACLREKPVEPRRAD